MIWARSIEIFNVGIILSECRFKVTGKFSWFSDDEYECWAFER